MDEGAYALGVADEEGSFYVKGKGRIKLFILPMDMMQRSN